MNGHTPIALNRRSHNLWDGPAPPNGVGHQGSTSYLKVHTAQLDEKMIIQSANRINFSYYVINYEHVVPNYFSLSVAFQMPRHEYSAIVHGIQLFVFCNHVFLPFLDMVDIPNF